MKPRPPPSASSPCRATHTRSTPTQHLCFAASWPSSAEQHTDPSAGSGLAAQWSLGARGSGVASPAGLPTHDGVTRVPDTASCQTAPHRPATCVSRETGLALEQIPAWPNATHAWRQRLKRRELCARRSVATTEGSSALRMIVDAGTSSDHVCLPRAVGRIRESHLFARIALTLLRGTAQTVVNTTRRPPGQTRKRWQHRSSRTLQLADRGQLGQKGGPVSRETGPHKEIALR